MLVCFIEGCSIVFQFRKVQLIPMRHPGIRSISCVSIPQGPINTPTSNEYVNEYMFQFRKVQLIPLGQNGYAKFNKFQFRKVQLIHNHERNIYNLYEFQFRKVQLIHCGRSLGSQHLLVSIPQGPINTLSSIQQSPL